MDLLIVGLKKLFAKASKKCSKIDEHRDMWSSTFEDDKNFVNNPHKIGV